MEVCGYRETRGEAVNSPYYKRNPSSGYSALLFMKTPAGEDYGISLV